MGGELGSLAGPALVPLYPGIAQLGERQIWDLEAVRAGLTTWTTHAGVLEFGIQNGLKNHCPLRD